MRKILFTLILFIFSIFNAYAGSRFNSQYSCTDQGRTCVSSGTRIVDNFEVHRDCWEWKYNKVCNYPSKNNCSEYSHCYAVAELPCLLRDNYGNCVNRQKEFSCKQRNIITMDEELVRTDLVEREGTEQLICKGVPCIDGNCFDKSYMTDDDMMDSVSKLYAVSQAKGATDLNFKLFEGFAQHCSKKATSYTNCCSTSLKGWGKQLGAKCTKDEVDLIDKRQKNLCKYIGKENKQNMGVTTVVKHKFCCFGSLLNKVIQIQGREQLGIGWGTAARPDCRGLTLAEIMRLDFSKMDFSEFFTEIQKRMKLPKIGDIKSRLNSSMPNMQEYDNDPTNKNNKLTGVNSNLKDNSYEATQERTREGQY